MSDTLVEAPPIPPVTSTGGEMDHDGRNGKFATDNVAEVSTRLINFRVKRAD